MYDWQRRKDTSDLLRHDRVRNNNKSSGSVIKNKSVQIQNNKEKTPTKQQQQYPHHHLNVSSNIFNMDSNEKVISLSTEKQVKPQKSRIYDNPLFYDNERTKTEPCEEKQQQNNEKIKKLRHTNTFSSTLFKQNVDEEQIQASDINKNNNCVAKNRNASNKSQIQLKLLENTEFPQQKLFLNKKRVNRSDNNIFKPATPRSARENEFKIRDHTREEIFGDEPQECIKKPHPQPYEPLYSNRDQNASQIKQKEFYASRNENGDFLPLSSRVQRCQSSYEQKAKSNANSQSRLNQSTSDTKMQNLTPQMKKQMHMLGSYSDYSQPHFITKNKQIDKYQDEIRSYNDKWWNKIKKTNNNNNSNSNDECFLSNKQIAEQQKYKQLKSDFFEEINNQIFGNSDSSSNNPKDIHDPNSILANDIEISNHNEPKGQQQKQKKWQNDNTNLDKRRKDQMFSDLFGFGDAKAPPKNFKDDCIFPANFQGHKYDSIKFKADYPSQNIQYGKRPELEQQEKLSKSVIISNGQESDQIGMKQNMDQATSDQRYYANLSSCLDQNGYRNHYSRNNQWNQDTNVKFDKFKVVEKGTEDQHNVSINFGCPKNDEGKNQRIVEINFKSLSDKFDQNEFKKYCSRKGIHLVDFKYDYNKVNNKISGTGQLKIRDMHQDTNRIENVKDHLRESGLVIKNTKVQMSTSSANYSAGSHIPHKNSINYQDESPLSTFNPNISMQASIQVKAKINKKNIESKGFQLHSTNKKINSGDNTESNAKTGNANVSNNQKGNEKTQKQKKQYDIGRSEIDTAKKVVENHNWKKAIDGVQKQAKKNQEIRAKSALISRKATIQQE